MVLHLFGDFVEVIDLGRDLLLLLEAVFEDIKSRFEIVLGFRHGLELHLGIAIGEILVKF